MSVRLPVRPSLKILVTTKPIGFYSPGCIPTGPVVVLSIFLGAGTPPTPQKIKSPLQFFLKLPLLAKPLEAR